MLVPVIYLMGLRLALPEGFRTYDTKYKLVIRYRPLSHLMQMRRQLRPATDSLGIGFYMVPFGENICTAEPNC